MIGVIGCGNMASAIIKGIHHSLKDEKFYTYTPSFVRAEVLARSVDGMAVRELSDLQDCSSFIIACKPQQFDSLAKSVQGKLDFKGKYVISIMAAIPTETIIRKLGTELVTRIMPNTPSLLGEGISLAYHSRAVNVEFRQKCEQYFMACSRVYTLEDENLFDQVTTVTGSGPAYVFYFAKTLTDNLSKWGVGPTEARSMVTQLFKGCARLMEESPDKALSELVDEVTSKGGVTIEAIKVFQEKNLDQISERALGAAIKRSEELKKQFEH